MFVFGLSGKTKAQGSPTKPGQDPAISAVKLQTQAADGVTQLFVRPLIGFSITGWPMLTPQTLRESDDSPSQRRFLRYLQVFSTEYGCTLPPSPQLLIRRFVLHTVPNFDTIGGADP